MRYRQKPNGMWLVDYEDEEGKRRRISTGLKTAPQKQPPPEVKAAGREVVLGIRKPNTGAVPTTTKARQQDGRLTMTELFDRCLGTIWHPSAPRAKSQDTIRSNIKTISEWIGNEAVEDMTYTRLEQLANDMREAGSKPATVKRKLAVIGRALTMAVKWELIPSRPPMPEMKVENVKERVIQPDEEEALFAALEKRRQLEPARPWFKMRVLLWFLFDTGGRLGESIRLGPDDLHQTSDGETIKTYVTFPRYGTKSGKPRTLPLAERSVDALASLMDHLTWDQKAEAWRFYGFSDNYAGALFRELRADVTEETGMDLSDVTLHTIRHTTLTRLAQGGMELARLQVWAGHSDPKITADRYVHLIPSDLDRGLDILDAGPNTRDVNRPVFRTKPVSLTRHGTGRNGANAGTPTLQ